MEIGLLWFDDDPRRGLEDKLGRAAQRYRDKYGRWPNMCYVHPEVLADQMGPDLRVACTSLRPASVIRVISAPNILLHHYWLGENNGSPTPPAAAGA